MDIREVLHNEANKSTAAIMHLLEVEGASSKFLDAVRKKVGDILHSSKRRVLNLITTEEDDAKINSGTDTAA